MPIQILFKVKKIQFTLIHLHCSIWLPINGCSALPDKGIDLTAPRRRERLGSGKWKCCLCASPPSYTHSGGSYVSVHSPSLIFLHPPISLQTSRSWQYEVLSVPITQGPIVPAWEGTSLIRQTGLNARTMQRAQWRQEKDELAPCVQTSDKISWVSQWQLSFHSQREKALSLPLPSAPGIDTASTENSLSQTMLGPLGLVCTKKIGKHFYFFFFCSASNKIRC